MSQINRTNGVSPFKDKNVSPFKNKLFSPFKKIIISTLLLFLALSIHAQNQANTLENYQIASFNGVTRISLTFTRRPITNLLKTADSLQFTVEVFQCNIGNMPERYTTPDMYANLIVITSNPRGIVIDVTTSQPFQEIKQSDTTGRQYTFHIDIFRTTNPVLLDDFISHLDYYNFTNNRAMISETLRAAQSLYPNNQQLQNRANNNFNPPTRYSVRPLRNQTTQTPAERPAQQQQRTTTQPTTPTTTPAQQTTPRPATPTPAVTPPPPTVSEQPIQPPTDFPQKTETKNIDPSSVSMTLITRHDRFPTRIPQTKPIFNFEPEIQQIPEPVVVEPEVTSIPDPETKEISEPVVVETEPTVQPSVTPIREMTPQQPQIIYRAISDTTGLSESEKLILSYYRVASSDSILVSFLVGASANIVGDFHNAIIYLKQVPENDVNHENALNLLFDSYTAIGDVANANFYASLLNAARADTTDSGFFSTPVSLWMIAIGGAVTLIAGFIIAAIAFGSKKKAPTAISELDYAAHLANMQKAYNKQSDKPSESIDELDANGTLSDHYDDPPIVTEELTTEETAELVAEEKGKSATEDSEGFSDNEYRKNLILKLHSDGWNIEEISKELKISQREIDFIIRVNG